MATISGYSATLAGSELGSLTGVQSITVGGVEIRFDEVATVGDTNRIPENLPLGVVGQPATVRFVYDKTIYATLEGAVVARTQDTFTITDSGSSTDLGVGYVKSVTDKVLGTDGATTFTCTLQPKTYFAFTA